MKLTHIGCVTGEAILDGQKADKAKNSVITSVDVSAMVNL